MVDTWQLSSAVISLSQSLFYLICFKIHCYTFISLILYCNLASEHWLATFYVAASMDSLGDFNNLNTCCRTCLNNTSDRMYISIFALRDDSVSVAEMLSSCTSIKVSKFSNWFYAFCSSVLFITKFPYFVFVFWFIS